MISSNDMKQISDELYEHSNENLKKIKQNLAIPLFDQNTQKTPQKTQNSTFWSVDLPEITNRQSISALKAWGLIVYFLQRNISKENTVNHYTDAIKSKLYMPHQEGSSQNSKQPELISIMATCEAIESGWTFFIQTFLSQKKLNLYNSKARLGLNLKPLITPLRSAALGPKNPADRKLRELCYLKIIQLILPEVNKNFSLMFDNVIKPLFDIVGSKESADYVFQEQLILFLSQWIFNDQRDCPTLKIRINKNTDSMLDDDSDDDDFESSHYARGKTFINDISFMVKKEFSHLFSAPCLKQEGLFMFSTNSLKTEDDFVIMKPVEKLEFLSEQFKTIFESFFRKVISGFLPNLKPDSDSQCDENAKRLSKVLNVYFRSLCQLVTSYTRYIPKDEESEKHSSLLTQLFSRLIKFCFDNISQSFMTLEEEDIQNEKLKDWTKNVSLMLINSFIECTPVHVLLGCKDSSLRIDISSVIANASVGKGSQHKSPFFAVVYGLYFCANSLLCHKQNENALKITELLVGIVMGTIERLIYENSQLPSLYSETLVCSMIHKILNYVEEYNSKPYRRFDNDPSRRMQNTLPFIYRLRVNFEINRVSNADLEALV